MLSIDANMIAKSITDFFDDYSKDVTAAMKKGIDMTAERTKEIISDKAPVGTKKRKYKAKKRQAGKYKKSFDLKVAYDGPYDKRVVWFVKGHEYALTHLLEHGHALRQGGRAAARPHIIFGANYIKDNLEKNIKNEVEKLGH